MNKPQTFLEFRKEIDKTFDEAVEHNDTELLHQLNRANEEAKKQGKNFYQLLYEMLVRWHDLG